jgi:5-hydroxyisourate hydrolase
MIFASYTCNDDSGSNRFEAPHRRQSARARNISAFVSPATWSCTKIFVCESLAHHDETFTITNLGRRFIANTQNGLMGKLTTHVLDLSAGVPAAGLRIELFDAGGAQVIASDTTGPDGRCAAAMLEGAQFVRGRYELKFYVADYFRAHGVALADPPFIEHAVIHFGIAHPDQHYHVPLLITPWSYSVYRGG